MNSDKTLAILGAGGFGAEVLESARAVGWIKHVFFDDAPGIVGLTISGAVCEGSLEAFLASELLAFVIAIGNNRVRHDWGERLRKAGKRQTILVHPSAVVSPSAVLSAGTIIAPLVFIGPNVRVGRDVIVNVGASIGHDAVLGDAVQVCPGVRVSGWASIEEGAFVGSNAVIAPRVSVKSWAKVAAGSFATRDVQADTLVMGVPARRVE